MKKALLVIDMQNVYLGEESASIFKYNKQDIISNVNSIIDSNKENLVVYIKNVMKKNLLNKFAPYKAYEGTKEVELIEQLNIVSDNVFSKYEGNAFSNANLCSLLKENNIECIEVVGIDGGGCVSLTAIGAINEGYKVILNNKAIGTMLTKKRDKYYLKLQKMGADFII